MSLEIKYQEYIERCKRLEIEPVSVDEWRHIQYVDFARANLKGRIEAGEQPPFGVPTFEEWLDQMKEAA